jgi:PAS domain S-box-containing protein
VPELLRQETFDLLLTDIRMPKIDGLQLLRIAKEIDPHLTVVLITGYGTMEDAIKAIRLGAHGFIMKPFEPEDLIDAVKDNLARRALIRDSLRLQTLLPLLEISQILRPEGRPPGGETLPARRVLEIAHRETGAARIAWLSRTSSSPSVPPSRSWAGKQPGDDVEVKEERLVEMAVAPAVKPPASRLPREAISIALRQARPVGVLADETILAENIEMQPNIVGVVLPLIIEGQVVGLITAETGEAGRTGPFNQISLDLLSVLAGQLAIVLENVQLFQQTETLHAFNEDVIQNMTNGLIATDRNLQVTVFNPAAASMLGYRSEEVLYQPLSKVIKGARELVRVFKKVLASQQACAHQEITIPHWDGTPLPVSISTAPLLTRDGACEPVGVVAVLEDLSEIKALEAERRRLDRLAALGEMSAVVAHEIRNPIAGIAAGVDYFTRNIPPDSPEHEGAAMIQGEIERVNRILEDILFIARPLQLNVSEQELPTIVENVIQRCQPQLKENQVDVAIRCEENLPLLQVDRQRLEQVFTNLAINAIQVMQTGGLLSLEIYAANTRQNGNPASVIVTITDTGPGIPPDVQRRIFEPFFTTKAKGTGLGLAVARRIVEEHGGKISVESRENQGTRFIIELPVTRRTTT